MFECEHSVWRDKHVGAGIVVIFWIIIAAIGTCFWFCCLGVLLFAWRRRWRVLGILAAIPLVGMPLAAAAIGALFAVYTGLGFYPPFVYRLEFNEAPTADVRELSGYKFGFADSEDCYLRFRASNATVARLVVKAKFEPISEKEFRSRILGLELTPPSWNPFNGTPTKFYSSGQFDNSSGYSVASKL